MSAAVVRPLACQEVVAGTAYADREEHAFRVVAVAIEKATGLIRSGHPGRAQFELARAGVSARRILGEAVSS